MHKLLKIASILLLFISFTMIPMDRFTELIESNVPTIDHRIIPHLFALSSVSFMGYGTATDSPAISIAGVICGIVWCGITYADRTLDSGSARNHFPGREA